MRRKQSLDQIKWGDDLSAIDEAENVRMASLQDGERPVLIVRYPAEIKFFNMKLDPKDLNRALSADLILPGAGEALGAAVREDDYQTLVHRLRTSRMMAILSERGNTDESVFLPYLELIREHKTQPHAGYGLGLERFLQFLIQSSDVRDVSLPYRLRNPNTPTMPASVQ
jgi:asparaginyl-tRNA synthetase